ncbi:MAG: glycosyltransferase family 9 protein [Gemmataceae bacterium]
MSADRKVPLQEYDAHRIALIKPSALGDIVHSLPVLTALRRRYPQAHITWIVNRSYEPLLTGHPDLDATLLFDRKAVRKGLIPALRSYGDFFRLLARQQFDLVIDLQGLLRTGLMAAATRAPRRVGFSLAREGAPWFYTDHIPGADMKKVHAVDRYWLVCQAFGVGDTSMTWRFPSFEAEHLWATDQLADWPQPWLMFGVGARWVTKRWPPAHFALLARWAQTTFGGTIIFVGGSDETPMARRVGGELTGPWLDLTGKTTLPRLAAVLALADVMVANDTGPLHLAVALGRPVVAPYTCTKATLTGPYGSPHVAVETRVWCQGSYVKKCPRLECMTELTPDRLWPVLRETLQQWQHRRRSA